MELYAERGFEQTTVADISERAGLTKRTFFRHYADKRDVLFSGTRALLEAVTRTVAEAPPDLSAFAAVARGLDAAARVLQEAPPEFVRMRQSIIDAHVELQERELVKLYMLGQAVAETLRGRGVEEWTARLAAETGITAFRLAFARWLVEAEMRDLAQVMRETLRELATTVSEG
jgi:AcrR family transcriptional regulator